MRLPLWVSVTVLASTVFWCGCERSPASIPQGEVAPPPNQLTAAEKATGWKLLFNGKTMAGWEDPAKETPPGDSWVVEGGCLKSVLNPRIREDLFTKESFENFELVFDWRIAPGGNSGLKYRVQDRVILEVGEKAPGAKRFEDTVDYELRHRTLSRDEIKPDVRAQEYVVAFEYQLIDDLRHPDAKYGLIRNSGSIYGLVPVTERASKPAGEFNHSRIVLRGNHVQHWLNGIKVVDANLASEKVARLIAKRWGTSSRVYELLTKQPRKKTPIELQHHRSEVWFRNLKIREL